MPDTKLLFFNLFYPSDSCTFCYFSYIPLKNKITDNQHSTFDVKQQI